MLWLVDHGRPQQAQKLLRAGQTFFLGGIEQDNAAEHDWRVPGVSEVPLIGHLFRKNNRAQHHQQLLLLITPRLITSE